MSTSVQIVLLVFAQAFLPGSVVINEFMAANGSSLRDPQGEYDDWVELFNRDNRSVNVGGLYLTDDQFSPMKWRIPDDVSSLTTVPAGGYLILWLDKDIDDEGLHATFSLDADGEELLLFDSDGVTLTDRVAFGAQTGDVSYGRSPDGGMTWGFLESPSPGGSNGTAYEGAVADVVVSHERGFYDGPFELTLSCETPDAVIRYTLDGSEPGVQTARSLTGSVYSKPLRIATTTCLRVRAVKPGARPGRTTSHTFIFPGDVIHQPSNPAGFPASWAGAAADYEMDPEVVNDPAYRNEIVSALRTLRTMSIVMPLDDLFGNQRGIYSNAVNRGDEWERPTSVEIINPDGSTAYVGSCGIRIHSYSWRTHDRTKKHSFRLEFRKEYGPTKMEYKLFPESPVDRFDSIVLRAQHGRSWAGQQYPDQAQYIRDAFARDTARDMGKIDGHATFVHLYLNGLYWGLYNPVERPDAQFAEEYFGGSEEDYDALNRRTTTNEAIDGDLNRYNEMLALADRGLASPEAYTQMQRYVDLDNLIDIFLIHQYTTNKDGPEIFQSNNQRAIGSRIGDPMFRFFVWDMEYSIWEATDFLNIEVDVPTSISHVYTKLRENAEFRLRYADRVHKHLFNGGALTPEAAAGRWETRAWEIYDAIVCESARWGDAQRAKPYTRNVEWMAERNRLHTTYFPQRTQILLGQLKTARLYPSVEAPRFLINGVPQHGGCIQDTDELFIQAPAGTIYYTLDGSDPRGPTPTLPTDGGVVVLVAEDASKRVLVPGQPLDDGWRASLSYNDLDWRAGVGGVGYERDSGYESLISTDVGEQMYGLNTTCCIRIPFECEDDPCDCETLTLNAWYDDGFVAYLNGVEIARTLFTGEPRWDSHADSGHEADGLHSFDVSAWRGLLQPGVNLLAIQGMNASSTSSDFLISVELVAGRRIVTDEQTLPTTGLYEGPIVLSASACVKSRVRAAGGWSAMNEAVFAVGPVAECLRISEIMYHPGDTGDPNDPNTEFIELTNIGDESINLNLVRFSEGVDFTFPSATLIPGGCILVVKDPAAFEARYGPGLPIAGRYEGNLSNAGERLRLQDAARRTIHDFRFEDGWYKTTDGEGCSLVVIDPATTDPMSLDDETAWRVSRRVGGSPGIVER
ncbi:MAG: lamin tail domain-containing protein [Solirubrobacterales bacterium]